VAAGRRTHRDERRRSLGQNFLRPERARTFVANLGIGTGDLVVEIGAGSGAVTVPLARTGADVVAVEVDPVWAERVRRRTSTMGERIRVVRGDFLAERLPARPFRVVGCVPFGETTNILHKLLDDPAHPLLRADLIVQLEVARKRAAVPPSTLLSTSWTPWWNLRVGARIDRTDFRPVPRVDAAILMVTRRDPPLLPVTMAPAYAGFVRANWPFPKAPEATPPRTNVGCGRNWRSGGAPPGSD
jgi:23S rRNA (adenine-N6)-dimethyltransferase